MSRIRRGVVAACCILFLLSIVSSCENWFLSGVPGKQEAPQSQSSFTVTVAEELTGGAITFAAPTATDDDPPKVDAGDTVTLTVTPDADYALGENSLTYQIDGNDDGDFDDPEDLRTLISFTAESTPIEASFTMPNHNVVLRADFDQSSAGADDPLGSADPAPAARIGEETYDTLSEAIAAAPDDGTVENPAEIVILTDIDLDGEELTAINDAFTHLWLFVEAGKTCTIARASDATDRSMFSVGSGKSLAIGKAGTGTLIIDGGSNNSAHGQIVSVSSGGEFRLHEGGVLQNNYFPDVAGGGVIVSGGTFRMTGGAVSGNRAAGGGGVKLESGIFEMTGGAIQGNEVTNSGGGVSVTGGTFTMTGGTISGNIAGNSSGCLGGGVLIDHSSASVTMNGGTVSGNQAYSGGGVALRLGSFTMTGGAIYGSDAAVGLRNTASGSSAALYINPGTAAQYGGAYTVYGTLTATDNTIPAVPPVPPTARIGATDYDSLSAAIGAATGTSAESPTDIIICKDIDLDETERAAIASALTEGKHVRLSVEAGKTYTIKRLESAKDNPMFTVDSSTESLAIGKAGGGTLIIDGGAVWTGEPDSVLGRGTTNSGVVPSAAQSIVSVIGGTFTLNDGGILQNNQNNQSTGEGGAVYVGYVNTIINATFIMNGGTIANNAAANGGGVSCGQNRTFTMTGGVVSGNSATSSGGGVRISVATGGFNLSGNARISNNSAAGNGGGVALTGYTGFPVQFNMSGSASVSNNAATGGGADGCGGGVYAFERVTLNLSGGVVANNSARNGGGVYTSTNIALNLSGGVVADNSATTYGGGVYIISTTFTMDGGAIQKNSALQGGGLYNGASGAFTMNGGVIYGTGSGLANTVTASGATYYGNDGSSAAFGSADNCLGGFVGTTSKSPGESISTTNDTIQATPKP